MEFKVLKRNNIKRNVIIVIFIIVIISAVILNYTLAKYRVTDSVPIIHSEINYTPYDFKIMAMYQEDDTGEYIEIEQMPSSGYVINEEKSYCTLDNVNKDNEAKLYTNDNGEHVFSGLKKSSKCYLYFDEYIQGYTISEIIADYNIGNRGSFASAYTVATTNIVFQTTDWKGTSYYFAGAPTDNWVRFGEFYWRIVRVNGDGSVRLIYNGTSTTTTGTGTLINNGSSQAFNTRWNKSEYVGLKYTTGQQHGQTTDSPILDVLQSWYSNSGLSATQYSQYIDTSVGFCSDRNVASGYSWSSQPSDSFVYSAYGRLNTNKTPSLSCTSTDIIAESVGLITADEVSYAGGVVPIANSGYYLYNGKYYWTMSPYSFGGSNASVYSVSSNGTLDGDYGSWAVPSVRPVINLKADTRFIGSGTVDSPFEVV